MATFQEQVAALLKKYVPAEKQSEALGEFSPMETAMTRVFQTYDTDLNDLKGKVRKVEGITPEFVASIEKENADLKAMLADHKAKLDSTTSELGTVKKRADDFATAVEAFNVEKAVRGAMSGFQIAPEASDVVFNELVRMTKKKEDGTYYIPHTVTAKNGIGVEETSVINSDPKTYMEKVWAVTPFAKRVLLADFSSGGGAGGNKNPGKGGGKPWKDMSFEEQNIAWRTDPVAAKAAMDSATAKTN